MLVSRIIGSDSTIVAVAASVAVAVADVSVVRWIYVVMKVNCKIVRFEERVVVVVVVVGEAGGGCDAFSEERRRRERIAAVCVIRPNVHHGKNFARGRCSTVAEKSP